jgi:hypothetical protein
MEKIFMKIFNTIIITLFTITLLLVSPSFGMENHKQPKKVFGPHMATPNLPADVEKHREEQRKQHEAEHLDLDEKDLELQEACFEYNEAIRTGGSGTSLLQKINSLLSTWGAEPNFQNLHGEAALHKVVKDRRAWQVVQSLLQWKANPNIQSRQGYTPLHIATMHENDLAIDLLLEAGADTSIKNKYKQQPMHFLNTDDRRSPLVYLRYGKYAPHAISLLDKIAFRQLEDTLTRDKKTQNEYAIHLNMLPASMQKAVPTMPNSLISIIMSYLPTMYTSFSDLPTTSQFSVKTRKPKRANAHRDHRYASAQISNSSLPGGRPVSPTSDDEGEVSSLRGSSSPSFSISSSSLSWSNITAADTEKTSLNAPEKRK